MVFFIKKTHLGNFDLDLAFSNPLETTFDLDLSFHGSLNRRFFGGTKISFDYPKWVLFSEEVFDDTEAERTDTMSDCTEQ